MNKFYTINPATEEHIQAYQFQDNTTTSLQIDNTYQAWLQWKNSTFSQRKNALFKISAALKSQKETLGLLITTEMGKPLNQAIAEVEKCAWVCEYYAENGEQFLKDKLIKTEAQESFIHHAPLGIIFAIMPWNFPFWQVFRCAAPALMAGNAMLLKHAPNTTGCGLAISKIIQTATSNHLFQSLIVDLDQIESIIANPKIVGVTLTGSTKAGQSVGALAGKHLKKSVLELGGSDPYVILDDADIDQAVRECINGRFLNTGQSCIAAKRFIVTQKNEGEFTLKILNEIKKLKYGNPKENYNLGSMARPDLREQIHKQVLKSERLGAKILHGGKIPEGLGSYYPATLITNVTKGMPAYEEELFGPVAVIISAKTETEAISIANDTTFGLGASIFSTDTQRAKSIAKDQINAGCCFVNAFVKSDPRLPFGGIGQSGYGRELSEIGITEFVNTKTVYIQ